MSAKLHRLWHAQGGRCFYCERATFLPGSGESKDAAKRRFGISAGEPGAAKKFRRRHATLEHLTRVAEGGTKRNENLVMACKRCNVTRGERPVHEHKKRVAALIEMRGEP